MKYDSSLDAFIPKRPYKSWTLDEKTCLWEAPVPYPKDIRPYPFGNYDWDENTINWKKL